MFVFIHNGAELFEKFGQSYVTCMYFGYSIFSKILNIGTGDSEGVISGSEVINLFSCSTQLSMEFFLLINVKMPTTVGILTFMSRKNSIFGLSESEKS